MEKRKVSTKFYWLIATSLVLSISTASFAIYLYLYSFYKKEIREKDMLYLKGVNMAVQSFIDQAFALNYSLSVNHAVIKSIEDADINWDLRQKIYSGKYTPISPGGFPLLVTMKNRFSYVDLFFIQDSNGNQTIRSSGLIGKRGNRWWFKQISNDKNKTPFFSSSYYSMTGDKPVASAFHPVFSNGNYIGIMGTDINFSKLQELVSNYLRSYDLYAVVTDNQGVVIAHPQMSYVSSKYNLLNLTKSKVVKSSNGKAIQDRNGYHKTIKEPLNWPDMISNIALKAVRGKSGVEDNIIFDGIESSVYYQPVNVPSSNKINSNYATILIRNNNTLTGTKIVLFLITLSVCILSSLILTSIFSLQFRKSILLPLNKIVEAMKNSDIESTTPIELNSGDEFQTVADAYNNMVNQLVESHIKLKNLNRELETSNDNLLKTNKDLISEIDEKERTIEEKNQLESKLRQARKMESIGTLAGGIAHDFNNILGAIIGYSEIAIIDMPDKSLARESIDQVLVAGHRAKNLVRQILDFSRQSNPEKKEIKLYYIIGEVVKLLKASLPANIEIQSDILTKDCSVNGNATQIHQLLMNLCTNASHAIGLMPGIINIRLEKTEVTGNPPMNHSNLKSGFYLKLSVKDNGCGIDGNILEKIFDPYFTTKEFGKGTGMGLAVVHGIVQEHKGSISIESKLNSGTTFEILFPCLVSSEKKNINESEQLPGGKERILIIDDESALSNLEKTMLIKLGYDVISKTNSTYALNVFKMIPAQIDLIITDMNMPGMNGKQLADKIREIRPEIPIILCTGYSLGISQQTDLPTGINAVLMKPLTMKAIATTVRDVLDSKITGNRIMGTSEN